MALSRPLLLALLGAALLAATVFAVQNARDKSADSPATVAEQAPAEQQATPAPPPAGPEELLASALNSEFTSAAFDAKLTFTSLGERNVIQATGAYEDHGANEMPELEVDVRLDVDSMNLNERGGFVSTGDRAWFTRGATAYAVPQSVWSEFVEARKSGAEPAAEAPELNVDPTSWVKNVKSEGTEQVNGVQATHVSAQLDSLKAVGDVVKAMSQGATQLPAGAQQQLRRTGVLGNADLDVWVGDDKTLRRLTLSLSGKGEGGRPVKAEVALNLSGVNEPQDVARPAKVKKGMPGGSYGQFTNSMLAGVAQSAGLNPQELRIGVPVTNSHLKAERAVADNKKVVIFFQNPRALDDQAVADSVRSLDRRTKSVVVLTDVVQNVDLYDSLLEDLGVNQAPAIVVIDRSGEASLIEGYTDAQSLAQVVADAR